MSDQAREALDVLGVGIDWDLIRSAEVRLRQPTDEGATEVQLLLVPEHPVSGTRAIDPGTEYSYEVDFVTRAGQRLAGKPSSARFTSLVIASPFEDVLQIGVMGLFDARPDLRTAAVSLRYNDAANEYVVDRVLTLSKESHREWTHIPVLDKSRRVYQFRVTYLFADGRVREGRWQETDEPLITVAPPPIAHVTVVPAPLQSSRYVVGKIELSADGATGPERQELVLERPFAGSLLWTFEPASPERRAYRYRVTLFDAEGRRDEMPETTSESAVLLVAASNT